MRSWLKRQWEDVKGNAKWAIAIVLWGLVTQIGQYVLHHAAKLPTWEVWIILGVLSLIAFVWLTKQTKASSGQQMSDVRPQSIPSLSTTAATFDPKKFFAVAYISPLTDEAENNIRAVGMTYYQNANDREAFYTKFIGVGLQAYVYDHLWWLLFKSQILLLRELNHKVLTIDEAKAFFDAAANEYPEEYAKDTFERWLEWPRSQLLLSQEGMKLAITPKGRDFLKYVLHTGRSEATKRL